MTERPELIINLIDDTFDFLHFGITKPVLTVTVFPYLKSKMRSALYRQASIRVR